MGRTPGDRSQQLVKVTRRLARDVESLRFAPPVAHVYNPARYASKPYEMYLKRFAGTRKRAIFQGMNPGPWGMAQTGIPFGEVTAVREWMGIEAEVGRPEKCHPRRPVLGFDVKRKEVSGRRVWGLMQDRFGTASRFFRHHFVCNYCPLVLYDADGRNITPDKLKRRERDALFAVCDVHLEALVRILQPGLVIGIGKFSEGRIRALHEKVGGFEPAGILHPSPASPLANRNWAGDTIQRLEGLGLW